MTEVEEKEEVCNRFQDKFADKTLSFGCVVFDKNDPEFYGKGKVIEPCDNGYRIVFDNVTPGTFSIKLTSIGHPVTRGRLQQEHGGRDNDHFSLERLEKLLLKYELLDKTIYDWVKDSEVLGILIEIKEMYG